MSAVNEQIFEQVKASFAGVEVSQGALFEMVYFHFEKGMPEIANRIAAESYLLLDVEDFIKEGETSYTDIFLEVFRRISFGTIVEGVHSMTTYDQWIADMNKAAAFLTAYADQIRATAGMEDLEVSDGSA